MRILLVRHGESQGNVDPNAYGMGDRHVSLTAKGRRELRGTHDFLVDFYAVNPYEGRAHPQAIDVSTYRRTRQSARLGAHSFRDHPAIRIQYDDELREQSFGLLYRMHGTCDEALSARIALAKAAYQQNPFEAVPPDGESPAMHYARTVPVVDRFLMEKEQQGIIDRLVFAHGATNRHIMTRFLGLPPNAWKHIQNQNNGDVSLLEDKGQGFTLRKIYDGPSGARVEVDPVIRNLPLPIWKP